MQTRKRRTMMDESEREARESQVGLDWIGLDWLCFSSSSPPLSQGWWRIEAFKWRVSTAIANHTSTTTAAAQRSPSLKSITHSLGSAEKRIYKFPKSGHSGRARLKRNVAIFGFPSPARNCWLALAGRNHFPRINTLALHHTVIVSA